MIKTTLIVIDASHQPLGRLASRLAVLLMGKHRIGRRAHDEPTQQITVTNCAKVHIEKKKFTQKLYYRTSGHPGGLRAEMLGDVFARDPRLVVQKAVWGMLPKNNARRTMIQNLHLVI